MPVIALKESVAGNVVYSWWCPRCGYDHYGTHCPFDSVTDGGSDGYQSYDVCLHCGQLTRRI